MNLPAQRSGHKISTSRAARHARQALALLALLGTTSVVLNAAGISYTGTFAADDDKRIFYFSVSQGGAVTLRTWSYAGGINAAGSTIPQGGFDPTISVFDANGNLIASNRDGGCGNVAADSVTSFCWDSYLALTLPAGNYSAVLTEADNLPNGPTLAQSFVYDPSQCAPSSPLICPTNAQGVFTAAPGNAPAGFWDFSPTRRTANYALDIVGAGSTETTAITSSTSLPTGGVGGVYAGFHFTAQSGAQATLSWSVVSGALPPGLVLNTATGRLAGAPTTSGDFTFSVQVTDGVQPSAPQQITIMIYSALAISAASLPDGVVGQPYLATVGSSGGSGTYVWSATALPAGLSFSPDGVLSGNPAATFSGPVTVTATDPATGISASANLALSITAAPLVISGGTNLGDVALGSAVTASFSASGGVPPYSWSLTGAPGLALVSGGNISGATSQAGNFTPTLTVTDSVRTSSSTTLRLAVLGITGAFPDGTTTASYNAGVSGVGGVPPYTYSLSGVPQGLTVSAGALSGQIKTPGTYTIGARVTDSNGVSAAQNFSFTATGPAPSNLTIVTTALPDGFAGQPYSQTLGATGGAPGYTWSVSGGQMPSGLSLNGSGTISGVPVTPGEYTVGVQVADTSGAQVVGTVTINIDAAPVTITSGSTLPSGLVGVDYPAQILTASGGVPPYTFSVKESQSLPTGLTLTNGQIAGAPSATGNFSFTLVATDSATTPNTGTLAVSMSVTPNVPSLVLSAATESFAIAAGTTAAPQPDTISVSSSVASDILTFTAVSSAPWLTAGGATTTPGSLAVGPNAAALSLSAAGSPYAASVTLTCTALLCAGKMQTIGVSLTISAPPPQLSLGSPLLSFTALTSNPQTSSTALSIVNAGGGSLEIQSVSAADSWISVGAFPSTVAPGPGGSVTVTVNPSGLSPGYYLSSVTVVSAAGTASVPVTLLLASAGVMTLGPGGTQFSLPQGATLGNSSGSFLVSVSSGSVNYAATVVAGSWLTGGGAGTASAASPGVVSFSIDPAAAAALPAGAYYGTIRVTSSGVINAPQDFQVILNISPPSSPVVPDPEPAGLLFLTSGSTPPAQLVQLFASSTNPISFQAAASTIDGAGWLSITPQSGTTAGGAPAQISVKSDPTNLSPGVYRGSVSFAVSAAAIRTVNVTLIVETPAGGSSGVTVSGAARPGKSSPAASGGGCSKPQLVPTQTGLVSNFSAAAAWPTPLAITLVDTCGSAVANGQVVATFSNGDPPLILALADSSTGLYSGTWTPQRTSSQVTILARASAPTYATATTQIAGQVPPNTVPVLAPNSTSDIFHPQVGAGLGPGNIVQIYGSGLAGEPSAPDVLPLPKAVNGTSVIIGGIEAPLYYVSPGQINAQIPFELAAGNQYQVIVNANGALTTPQPIQLTAAVPAILQFNSGQVVAQHQDGTIVQDSSPATPGEYLTIYLTGLGATDIQVASGSPSPSDPPANVIDKPVLTLNKTQVPVIFAGLTPEEVGLYQIDFQLPQPLADGNYSLFITQSGATSNRTVLPVANQVSPETR